MSMETVFECHGLPASWINGWLAAVGCTVLDPRIRLRWTTDATPVAVLSASECPVKIINQSWPDKEILNDFPIAESWGDSSGFERKVTLAQFRERTRSARGHEQSWTLSSTLTDLCLDEKTSEVSHARFDPSGPGTIKWLHHRLMEVYKRVENPSASRLEESFRNLAPRAQINGLGFDLSRMGSLADDRQKWTDPVVELLAFFGLYLLPVRGRPSENDSIQRGWHHWPTKDATGRQVREFAWPAWRQPLDRDGIDALLDAWVPRQRDMKFIQWKRNWGLLGIHAGWRIYPYRTVVGSSDSTTAFGSQRLCIQSQL